MEGGEPKRLKSRRVLVAVISSVVTAVVVLAVLTSLFFGTKLCSQQTESDPKIFFVEISDDPGQTKFQIRKADKLILTESTKDAANVDHTVTLQDFKRGLQAVRDLDKSKCFVFPTFGQFESIEKIVESKNISSSTVVEMVDKTAVGDPIPPELINLAVGENIADFCEGLDTYWLVDSADSDEGSDMPTQLRKRRTEIEISIRFRPFRIRIRIRF